MMQRMHFSESVQLEACHGLRSDPLQEHSVVQIRQKIQILPKQTGCDMLVLLSYPNRQRRGGDLFV